MKSISSSIPNFFWNIEKITFEQLDFLEVSLDSTEENVPSWPVKIEEFFKPKIIVICTEERKSTKEFILTGKLMTSTYPSWIVPIPIFCKSLDRIRVRVAEILYGPFFIMSSEKIIESEQYLTSSQYTNNINLIDSYILNTFTGFMSSKHSKKIAMGKIESDLLISLEIYGSNNNFLSYYSIFNYNFETLWAVEFNETRKLIENIDIIFHSDDFFEITQFKGSLNTTNKIYCDIIDSVCSTTALNNKKSKYTFQDSSKKFVFPSYMEKDLLYSFSLSLGGVKNDEVNEIIMRESINNDKSAICSEGITNNSVAYKMIFIDTQLDRDIFLISDRQSFLCLVKPVLSDNKRKFLNRSLIKPYSWVSADDYGNIYAFRIGSFSAPFYIDIYYTNYAHLQDIHDELSFTYKQIYQSQRTGNLHSVVLNKSPVGFIIEDKTIFPLLLSDDKIEFTSPLSISLDVLDHESNRNCLNVKNIGYGFTGPPALSLTEEKRLSHSSNNILSYDINFDREKLNCDNSSDLKTCSEYNDFDQIYNYSMHFENVKERRYLTQHADNYYFEQRIFLSSWDNYKINITIRGKIGQENLVDATKINYTLIKPDYMPIDINIDSQKNYRNTTKSFIIHIKPHFGTQQLPGHTETSFNLDIVLKSSNYESICYDNSHIDHNSDASTYPLGIDIGCPASRHLVLDYQKIFELDQDRRRGNFLCQMDIEEKRRYVVGYKYQPERNVLCIRSGAVRYFPPMLTVKDKSTGREWPYHESVVFTVTNGEWLKFKDNKLEIPNFKSENECEILNNDLVDKDYIFTCLGKHSSNNLTIGDTKPSVLEEIPVCGSTTKLKFELDKSETEKSYPSFSNMELPFGFWMSGSLKTEDFFPAEFYMNIRVSNSIDEINKRDKKPCIIPGNCFLETFFTIRIGMVIYESVTQLFFVIIVIVILTFALILYVQSKNHENLIENIKDTIHECLNAKAIAKERHMIELSYQANLRAEYCKDSTLMTKRSRKQSSSQWNHSKISQDSSHDSQWSSSVYRRTVSSRFENNKKSAIIHQEDIKNKRRNTLRNLSFEV